MIRDLIDFCKGMSTLPWTIQVWASLYPLPQVVGGLIFITTLPGMVILLGRLLSLVIASKVHKRRPFSKMIGPISHAHWLILLPWLGYVLTTESLSTPLYWFIVYVIATSTISWIIDFKDLFRYLKQGESRYRRELS